MSPGGYPSARADPGPVILNPMTLQGTRKDAGIFPERAWRRLQLDTADIPTSTLKVSPRRDEDRIDRPEASDRSGMPSAVPVPDGGLVRTYGGQTLA